VQVDELFRIAGIVPNGVTSWGEPIPESGPGVYVVTIADPAMVKFDSRFEAERHRWLPDQSIVYIGRASQLRRRLRQFYRHEYGRRSPHHGGQAILLLKCELLIHWAAVADYGAAEHRLIEAFESDVQRKPFGNRVRSARIKAR